MLNLFFPSNLFAVKTEASDKTKITNCKNKGSSIDVLQSFPE